MLPGLLISLPEILFEAEGRSFAIKLPQKWKQKCMFAQRRFKVMSLTLAWCSHYHWTVNMTSLTFKCSLSLAR